MTRYRIDWLPRVDHDPRRDPDQQRWTIGTVTAQGPDAAERECRQCEADYGPDLIFRAVPVPELPEESALHTCATCGGDLRERLGHRYACSCPVALAAPGMVRWVRPVVREGAA